MPATARRGSGKSTSQARQVFSSGPYKGVKNTTDPFDDTPDYLVDAVNMYVPDAQGGSGIYARPGTVLMNPSTQLGVANHMGQCVYQHTALDGTEYNFIAASGKLYRSSADLLTVTDVTPAGVTIDSATSTRVKMLTFADKLIVSDGVNRPWIGTNLSATPITGANIQYDVGNSLWSAQDMTTYSGALLIAIKTIAGVFHQTRVAWSAPNDPTQGYFNVVSGVTVDYTWDVVQTDSTPIYAVRGTNLGLIYWRAYSMGALTGPIGPDFKTTATHDAIDFKVGTRSPATIDQVGYTIFFADSEGRPQMLPLGNRLNPIWLNMRSVVEASRTDTPAVTALTACGAIFPTLNLYLVAIWSTNPSISLSPATLYAFDTLTGQYVGRWIIGEGVSIEAIGILKDANAQPELVVVGSKAIVSALGFGGYVWRLANVQENIWTDNGTLPTIFAQTARMGFAADVILYADRATAITGSISPCAISVLSASELEKGFITDTLETTDLSNALMTTDGLLALVGESLTPSTATPYPSSLDGTYRCVWGLDTEGRGFNVTVGPTTASSQWRLHRIELTAVSSQAPVEEA